VVVEAERVILAASATGSAAICLRSGLPDPCRLMGTNLHLHPGAAVLGFFEEGPALEAWRGVPQAVASDQFMDHRLGTQHRVWLVPGFSHPAMAAAMMPGFGAALAGRMRRYAHTASVVAMLHDESGGVVRPGRGEKVHLRYSLGELDRQQLALGLREAARVLLAAGAARVLVPLHPPLELEDPQQLDLIRASRVGAMSPALTAAHPMSTLWMGQDALRSVVDGRGQHHHVHGLYVADGSLLPTSLGVPPQLSIYALGRRVGRCVRQSFSR
jgi:choline dehydrogenase-like flavoprotein